MHHSAYNLAKYFQEWHIARIKIINFHCIPQNIQNQVHYQNINLNVSKLSWTLKNNFQQTNQARYMYFVIIRVVPELIRGGGWAPSDLLLNG